MRTYHAGMAALFAGLAILAAWRLGLPHGQIGWLATAVAAFGALLAARRASRA
ncbi:hypothetical protein D3C72_801200 [compost metagenome]